MQFTSVVAIETVAVAEFRQMNIRHCTGCDSEVGMTTSAGMARYAVIPHVGSFAELVPFVQSSSSCLGAVDMAIAAPCMALRTVHLVSIFH
jgi:hypothetical protein